MIDNSLGIAYLSWFHFLFELVSFRNAIASVSGNISASDCCALQEALYKCTDTLQCNTIWIFRLIKSNMGVACLTGANVVFSWLVVWQFCGRTYAPPVLCLGTFPVYASHSFISVPQRNNFTFRANRGYFFLYRSPETCNPRLNISKQISKSSKQYSRFPIPLFIALDKEQCLFRLTLTISLSVWLFGYLSVY